MAVIHTNVHHLAKVVSNHSSVYITNSFWDVAAVKSTGVTNDSNFNIVGKRSEMAVIGFVIGLIFGREQGFDALVLFGDLIPTLFSCIQTHTYTHTHTNLLRGRSRLGRWTGGSCAGTVSKFLCFFAFFLIAFPFPFVFAGESLYRHLICIAVKKKKKIQNR